MREPCGSMRASGSMAGARRAVRDISRFRERLWMHGGGRGRRRGDDDHDGGDEEEEEEEET